MDAQKPTSPETSSPQATNPRAPNPTKPREKPIISKITKPDVYFHLYSPAQSGEEGQGGRYYLINGVLRVTHPEDVRLGGAVPMTEEQTMEFYEDLVRMDVEGLGEKWRGYWVLSSPEVDRVFAGGSSFDVSPTCVV